MQAEQKIKDIIEKRRQGIQEPLTKRDVDAYLRETIDTFITPISISARPDNVFPVEIRDVIEYLLKKMTLLSCTELTGVPVMDGNVISLNLQTEKVAIERMKAINRRERAISDKDLRQQEVAHLRLAALYFELAKRYNHHRDEQDKTRVSSYHIIGDAIQYLRDGYYDEQTTNQKPFR